MMTSFSKKWNREAVSTDLWFNRNYSLLPEFKLQTLDKNVFASYSGPDCGLAFLQNLESTQDEKAGKGRTVAHGKPFAGCTKWNVKNRKAYGISMSLYDQHPVNGKITGDPIADCFGLCARANSALMVVADGVNWGEKSRMAARCAVYGVMKHINERLFPDVGKDSKCEMDCLHEDKTDLPILEKENIPRNNGRIDKGNDGVMSTSLAEELGIENGEGKDFPTETTKDVFRLILESLESAHKKILKHDGGLTTLCVCFVCPITDSTYDLPDRPSSPMADHASSLPLKKYAACVVNVGDSLAFVFSRRHGVREITSGSHDVTLERNIRDAGGALGPVTETGEPELNNLTCSVTCVEAGDVIFLATDGITDNFDPVVTKVAVAKKVDNPLTSSKISPESKGITTHNECMQVSISEDILVHDPFKEQHVGETNKGSSEQLQNKSQNEDGISDNLKLCVDAENDEVNPCHSSSDGKPVTKISDLPEEESSTDKCNPVSLMKEGGPVMCLEDQKFLQYGSLTNNLKNIGIDHNKLTESTHFEIEKNETKLVDSPGLENGKPVMLPFERHRYAIKEMERVIHEFELFTECPCSAQELCGALLQHVLKLTDPKRKVLENPDLYGKKKRLKAEERQNRDSEIVLKLAQSPGKLDHATVLGYEVGCYNGNEDEDYYAD